MAEQETIWPEGIQGAISLTYDGARLGHLETVAPLLRKTGLHATFFIDIAEALQCVYGWKSIVASGHELGNGCLLTAGDLSSWTPTMILDEISSSDEGIQDVFGPTRECPFAFPVGAPICGGYQDYREILGHKGRIARSGLDGFNSPESSDLGYLRSTHADDLTGAEMIALSAKAMREGQWLIFAFEGVGEGEVSVDASAHQSLILWLSAHQDIWISPIGTIAQYIKTQRKAHFRVV